MTSKTRLSNKVQITNIMRRLIPDYYLYVMLAREEVRSILSNPFSKKKNLTTNILSHNQIVNIFTK